MPNIFHQFPISASSQKVFQAVSTPVGLDAWWTRDSAGRPEEGAEYQLGFGPQYDWRAVVSRCMPNREFELKLVQAEKDWLGTRVGFVLSEDGAVTNVSFHHLGWPESNEHYRISCYCWAMYLRLLKRYVELGEMVRYEDRLDV